VNAAGLSGRPQIVASGDPAARSGGARPSWTSWLFPNRWRRLEEHDEAERAPLRALSATNTRAKGGATGESIRIYLVLIDMNNRIFWTLIGSHTEVDLSAHPLLACLPARPPTSNPWPQGDDVSTDFTSSPSQPQASLALRLGHRLH
jgi:hypothetical protein